MWEVQGLWGELCVRAVVRWCHTGGIAGESRWSDNGQSTMDMCNNNDHSVTD